MPKISQKGLQMPASPIRKLTPFANQTKKMVIAAGKSVYSHSMHPQYQNSLTTDKFTPGKNQTDGLIVYQKNHHHH